MSERRRRSARQRSIVKGLRTVVMLAAFLILGIGFMVPAAVADDDGTRVYSNQSVKGKWGFGGGGHGVVLPDQVPTAAVGTMTLDGMGGCVSTVTVNLNGILIGPITSQTCTYNINPDGTGSGVVNYGTPEFPDPIPVLVVIVDRGKELLLLNDGLLVISYSAKRM